MIKARDLSVMLFAAGKGTRMRQLTKTTPKPLIKVKGRALIDYALDMIEAFGPKTCVINTHYLAAQIHAHLTGRAVHLVHEQDLLETGGGVIHALQQLDSDVIATFNSDAVWRGDNPLAMIAQHWDGDDMDALLLCLPKENAIGYKGNGDFAISQDGGITRGGPFVYSGVQIIKTQPISCIQDKVFSLNLVWDDLIARGRAKALVYTGKWVDVGTPEGIILAETLLNEDVAHEQ